MRFLSLLLVLHLSLSRSSSRSASYARRRSNVSISVVVKSAGVLLFRLPNKQSNDARAARVLGLTVQEQGIMKYHTSSCYKSFQRDMAKNDSITQPLEQSEPSQQGPINDTSERCSKRFKSSVITNVCSICGLACKTVKQKKIHKLFRIREKTMARKQLNAAMLFKDHVYTETAAMRDVDDVFAADIL